MAKAKRDFTAAGSLNPVYQTIDNATADTEAQPLPRIKRGETPPPEVEKAAKNTGRTQGRAGIKMPRINAALLPDNFQYVKTMSRLRGESYSSFINFVLSLHKQEHPELYQRAKSIIDEMDSELDEE